MTALLSAQQESAFYQAWLANPQIAPVLANRVAIQQYLDHNLLTVTPGNIGKAIVSLGTQLAPNTLKKVPVQPTPEPAAPVESEQDRLQRLNREMDDPATRAVAKAELKTILKTTGPIKPKGQITSIASRFINVKS